MSNIGSYKNTAFSESQKFLVLDPATGSTSLVLGSSLIDYITPRLNSVIAETTRLSAENTDYDVGTLLQTSGATSVGDGLASVYLVVEGGTGDFPMINGNDLLTIAGDDALREQLISTASGEGASLVSMEGGPSVEVAVNNRVQRVASRTEMKAVDAPEGYQFSLEEGGRSGIFVVKSGTPPSDPQEGIYVVLDNGNYAERIEVFELSASWFGLVAGDSSTESSINAAIQMAKSGQCVDIDTGANTTLDGPINMKSGVKVKHKGKITFTGTATNDHIVYDATTYAAWLGGTVEGPTSTGTGSQSGFAMINGAAHNTAAPNDVFNFPNKGIDIKTGASNNLVWRGKWRLCAGSTGGGISIFGAGADRTDSNVIFEPTVIDCARGISVQGGYYNRVISPKVRDCTLWGVGLDGVVTASGDGAKYTTIAYAECDNASSSSFGGIYLGNGSSFNTIISPVCINNAGAGIRSSGGAGYQNESNKFISPVCQTNANGGIVLSNAPKSEINNPTVTNNTGRGIDLFISDNSKVLFGEVSNNTTTGLNCQSADCVAVSTTGTGNDVGVAAVSGGSD